MKNTALVEAACYLVVMKKIIYLVVMVYGLTFASQHESIFYPSQEAIDESCTQGYENPNTLFEEGILILEIDEAAISRTSLWTPLANVAGLCSTKARALEAKPDTEGMPSVNLTSLIVSTSVRNLDEAAAFAVALIVKDASGVETYRLRPDMNMSSVASQRSWNPDCRVSSCIWRGSNFYQFDMSDADFRQAVANGGTVSVIVQTSGNIRELTIPVSPE